MLRSEYRWCLERAKLSSEKLQETRLLEEASTSPHIWLKYSRPATPSCPVGAPILRSYFSEMFSSANTVPRCLPTLHCVWNSDDDPWRKTLDGDFTIAEVHETISSLPNNNTCGEDEIFNEHLKAASLLIPVWTELYNKCLNQGTIPNFWLSCVMILIPKGKGAPMDPSS